MEWTLAKRVLAAGLLATILAPIAGCYPYWRYRDWNDYRRDGYQRSDRWDRQRDYDRRD
jgi:hypothetical protein